MSNDLKCPYCGYEHEVNDIYIPGKLYGEECQKCSQIYIVSVGYDPIYTVMKPPYQERG